MRAPDVRESENDVVTGERGRSGERYYLLVDK